MWLQTGCGRYFDEQQTRAHKSGGPGCRIDAGRTLLGEGSREEAPDYAERVTEVRAEGIEVSLR
jgi:hypothetical protein